MPYRTAADFEATMLMPCSTRTTTLVLLQSCQLLLFLRYVWRTSRPILLDVLFKDLPRSCEIALLLARRGEIQRCSAVIRLLGERHLELLDGRVVLLLLKVGDAQIVVGVGKRIAALDSF